jgi:hypothetical protein
LTDSLIEAVCNWSLDEGELISSSGDRCEIVVSPPGGSFLCEYTLRFLEWRPAARAGFRLETAESSHEFTIVPDKRHAVLDSNAEGRTEIALPAAFDPSAHHLLRIEAREDYLGVQLDTADLAVSTGISGVPTAITFFSENAKIGISAIEITPGFEETFEISNAVPKEFTIENGAAECSDGLMLLTANIDSYGRAVFRSHYPEFELAANLAVRNASNAEYGLALLGQDNTAVARLSALPGRQVLLFQSENQSKEIKLPDAFEGNEFRQFRIVMRKGVAEAYFDGVALAEMPLDAEVTSAAVVGNTIVAIDMIRVTSI